MFGGGGGGGFGPGNDASQFSGFGGGGSGCVLTQVSAPWTTRPYDNIFESIIMQNLIAVGGQCQQC